MRKSLDLLGVMLMLVLVFVRAWSCSHVLGKFAPTDPVDYAMFDRHGIGAITGWFSALLFAPPMMYLSARILGPEQREPCALGPRQVAVSVLVAIVFALPTWSQSSYLIGLPVRLTGEIVVTSIAWAVLVGGFLAVWLKRKDAGSVSPSVRVMALGTAILIAVPKLLLLVRILLPG